MTTDNPDLTDPVAFAAAAYAVLYSRMPGLSAHDAPEHWAALERARRRLDDLLADPDVHKDDGDFWAAVAALEQAGADLGTEAHWRGVGIGAALEHLRRAIVAPTPTAD